MENIGDGNMFTDVLKGMAVKWINEQVIREGDWFDGDILYCGKCKKPRRAWRDFNGIKIFTTEMCDCDIAEVEERKRREQEKENQRRIAELKSASLMDEKYRNSDFARFAVTKENERQYRLAVRYCDKFSEMLSKNQGLLLYGPVGTGKTLLSACVGNRLMENLYSVLMTSFVKLLQKTASFHSDEDEDALIRKLNRASLLIVDDLGAERGTDFALEKVYNIVDSRYRAGKPVIYTTNLTLDEMQNTTDTRYRRIYDRIFETCYPVEFKGKSWRMREAAKRYDDMKSILEG